MIYFKYAISYQNPLQEKKEPLKKLLLRNPVDSAGVINYKGLK